MSAANRRASIGLPPAPDTEPGELRRRALLAIWVFLGGGPPPSSGESRSRARRNWITGPLAHKAH